MAHTCSHDIYSRDDPSLANSLQDGCAYDHPEGAGMSALAAHAVLSVGHPPNARRKELTVEVMA